MKRRLIAFFFAASLAGCASPPPTAPANSASMAADPNIAAQKAELGKLRGELTKRRQRLELASMQDEIELLKKEMKELQAQVDELQDRISKAEAIAAKNLYTPAATTPSAKNVGPRGGCYTITKSGKKNYGGC